ncbi:uncharacterized protein [Ptychodera flava]|uniref:uncharacterized protein n=1 Tax=Ptychodera flava TaxID=63121 RepID=UPI00396A2A5A
MRPYFYRYVKKKIIYPGIITSLFVLWFRFYQLHTIDQQQTGPSVLVPPMKSSRDQNRRICIDDKGELVQDSRFKDLDFGTGRASRRRFSSRTLSDVRCEDNITRPHKLFAPLHNVYNFTAIEQVPRKIVLQYDNFKLSPPHLPTIEDRLTFCAGRGGHDLVGRSSQHLLVGKVNIVRNGTFELPYDCGYMNDMEFLCKQHKSDVHVHALSPLIVPQAYAYQHFIDGTMPKLIQSLDVLKIPEVKILLEKPRNQIIYEMLSKLNISTDRVLWYEPRKIYSADYLVMACHAPPLHPVLWRKMRTVFGVRSAANPVGAGRVVLFTRRKGAKNIGRRMINLDDVIKALTSRYAERFVVLDIGFQKIGEAVRFFRNVSTIVAVHGGALYNMVFATPKTNVVEILPYGEPRHHSAVNIFWAQSELLGLPYWRLYEKTVSPSRDLVVNISKLTLALDAIDNT